MQSNNIEEYQRKVAQQKSDFRSVFGTEAGQRVLKALREEFYDNAIVPGDTLEFDCGSRYVIQQILQRLEDE